MREILFRGLRLDGRGWVEGSYCYYEGCCCIQVVVNIDPCNDAPLGDTIVEYYPVMPKTVGQATGLKDKTGKMIFEGDVVSARNVFEEEYGLGHQNKYSIGFYEGTFIFENKTRRVEQWDDGLHEWHSIENVSMYKAEIIGNLHETTIKDDK